MSISLKHTLAKMHSLLFFMSSPFPCHSWHPINPCLTECVSVQSPQTTRCINLLKRLNAEFAAHINSSIKAVSCERDISLGRWDTIPSSPFFQISTFSLSPRVASSSYHPPASFRDPNPPQLCDAEAGFTPLLPHSMHLCGLRQHHMGTNFALN